MRANVDACWYAYPCSIGRDVRDAFSFSRRSLISARDRYFSSTIRTLPHARSMCSGNTIAFLIFPPNRTSTTYARPWVATTVPVRPWNRLWGQPFWIEESMRIVALSPIANFRNARVMGESPRFLGLRRNFCRVFSMIPFEAFTMGSSAVLDVQDVQLDPLARH